MYVFTLYAVVIWPAGATSRPADRRLLIVAGDLRNEWLTDVAEGGHRPGRAAVVIALSLPVAAGAAGQPAPFAELVALVAGVLVLYVAVNLAKAGIDRPAARRGPDRAHRGSSFPSGHAAYSTIWIAVAVVVAARAAGRGQPRGAGGRRPGHRRRGRAVAHLPARALLVGRGRRLGAGRRQSWALCAAVALVVNHIRNNGGRGNRIA